MNLRTVAVGTAALLVACAGGSSSSSPSSGSAATLQHVSGTLTIGLSSATAQSNARKPAFVSSSTGHAAVFIDGGAAAAGSTSGCTTAVTGTGTGCTISWAAELPVPGSYKFAVETDTGGPANTVLSEGSGTYAIVAGSANTLSALSLNGIVKKATFKVTDCSGPLCNGTVLLGDAAGNAIAYTGATVVPTSGNSPSSGNVFDNGPVTFVSSNSVAGTGGLVTGTADVTDLNVFSALATNILTVSGVSMTGTYDFQVTCNDGATGTFGITVGGAATASTFVTGPELASLSPAVTYPVAGINVLETTPSFTCASGVISSASGTLPVN